MLLTIVLLTIVACLIACYLWTLKTSYDYFKRRGVPGPPPVFFFGHYRTLWSARDPSEQLQRWAQRYGSIYGLFQGSRPVYVVSDVNFLQEVYVKQFASFHSRFLPFMMKQRIGYKAHLLGASGATWRRQRHLVNPTFSAAKLKLMTPLVNHCVQSLMDKLKTMVEKQEQFNIYAMYKRLTMGVICRCAFGMDTDLQNDADNIFLHKAHLTIINNPETLFITKLGNLMPFLIPILHYLLVGQVLFQLLFRKLAPAWFLPQIKEVAGFWVFNFVRNVIKERIALNKNENQYPIDLLQLMIDAATNDDIKDDPNDDSLKSKKLRYDEVVSNVVLFMIAGYETTSTALASCTYVLATKHDIQEKLRAEIDEQQWSEDNQLNYDIVMNMSYMDCFIREVLRMYPITTIVTRRECNTATTVCGYQIEKDTIIQPDVFSVHYNHDLWGPEDPNLFIPERHQVKRHPMAYMPFGVGPRNCVGMRFALMELKMCLSQLLRHYTILPGENIEEGFKHRETLVIQPDAIYIKLEKR